MALNRVLDHICVDFSILPLSRQLAFWAYESSGHLFDGCYPPSKHLFSGHLLTGHLSSEPGWLMYSELAGLVRLEWIGWVLVRIV